MLTVLHIEDDDEIRALTALAFEFADDMELIQAPDGQTGLKLLEDMTPHLVLLDYMMPGLSGADVIRVMNRNDRLKRIPVAFVTARTVPEDEAKMRSLGAISILRKPFDPLALPNFIRTHATGL